MAVTEIAILQLVQPYKHTDKVISDFFASLSTKQSAWSSYPLYYFIDHADSSIVYLFSGWRDVGAHMIWIRSDENQALLKIAEPLLKVRGLVHLTLNFRHVPEESECVVCWRYMSSEGTQVPELSEEMTRGALWRGCGSDAEKLDQGVYYLAAYSLSKGIISFDPNELQGNEVFIMDRVYFE